MNEQHDNETVFLDSIKAQLDHSVDDLDDLTRMRLRRIRQQALQQVNTSVAPRTPVLVAREHAMREQWWMPAASVAAMVMISVLVFTLNRKMPGHNEDMTTALQDMPILSAEQSPEFYQNLDFYQWLETQKDLG